MTTAPFENIIFDIETDGLLPGEVDPPFSMTKIHCLGLHCMDSGERLVFRNNDEMNNLEEGVDILAKAQLDVGHNTIDFDHRAIKLIYPQYEREGRTYDTLVMSRMVFANIKESDFRSAAKGDLEGRLIGTQGLESWGQRLGLHKGDYKKVREEELKDIHRNMGMEPPTKEELHIYVWGEWNQDMEDYMIGDLDVSEILHRKIEAEKWSREAVSIEHNIHALMVKQEDNGFLFDVDKARMLEGELREAHEGLSAKAVAEIGKWYRPAKVVVDEVDLGLGENTDRRTWGVCTYPKRNLSYDKSNSANIEAGDYHKLRANYTVDAPFVKVELKTFNPNSRVQITDRLKTLYGWEPQDFTEKGSAKVDDEIMRDLADKIPLAETLAEVFYMQKRLGQVADGKNGWLKLLRPDGRIHGRVNVGGTVSGRATHAAPNISQVPGVNAVEFKDYQRGLDFIDKYSDEVNAWGAPIIVSQKWNDVKGEWKILTRGRTGGYGYDSRELFIVPSGYKLVGCDLSGIEFRCLANLTYPFDDGEMVETVLNGDIHQQNADLAGISRSVAKRLLYAAMYGGGDAKLGSIVEPFATEARQRTIGKGLRAKLMAAMPSLKKAIRAIHKEMRQNSGTIRGLDGRRLYARSKHSALNLRLQSDGAIIAKQWCLTVDDLFWEEGWEHDIAGDYAFCSWSHDEIQVAVRDEHVEKAARIMEAAAPMAGEDFGFKCPVEAKADVGLHWAATH